MFILCQSTEKWGIANINTKQFYIFNWIPTETKHTLQARQLMCESSFQFSMHSLALWFTHFTVGHLYNTALCELILHWKHAPVIHVLEMREHKHEGKTRIESAFWDFDLYSSGPYVHSLSVNLFLLQCSSVIFMLMCVAMVPNIKHRLVCLFRDLFNVVIFHITSKKYWFS